MTDPTPARGLDLADLGGRVRSLRNERGLSLSGLAAAAGVGKGSLSELEAGVRNPTLATLYALAAPLGVPMTTLLADRVGAVVSGEGLTTVLLGTDRTGEQAGDGPTIEVYRIDFAPDADRRSPAHTAGVREHLLIVSGELCVDHAAGSTDLGPGESVTFAGDRPHRYRSRTGQPCAAVLVITTPTTSV